MKTRFDETDAKERIKELFQRRGELENDRRKHDDGKESAQWLEEMAEVCNELVRMYVRYRATEDWLVNSIILEGNDEDRFDSVEGEKRMYEELREWAEE